MKKQKEECIKRVRIHAFSMFIILLMIAGCDSSTSPELTDPSEHEVSQDKVIGTWQPMGGGTDASVQALTVHGDNLIAGGSFLNAEGKRVNRVARWVMQ